MTLATEFLQWTHHQLSTDRNHRQMHPQEFRWVAEFDFCFEHSGSLTKGRQTQIYKWLPASLTLEQADHIRAVCDDVVRSRSGLFKFLQDFVVFFYVTDRPIPEELLMRIGSFRTVKKSVFGNISELRFLLETENGTYLMPERSGFFGWLPIKNLRDELRQNVLEPFRVWRQNQGGSSPPPDAANVRAVPPNPSL